jgi:hypothetical protein
MKFFFTIEVGIGNRTNVRQQLQNSKERIKYWYPQAQVLLTETKDWFESEFYFEVKNLPEDARPQMQNWLIKIKSLEK